VTPVCPHSNQSLTLRYTTIPVPTPPFWSITFLSPYTTAKVKAKKARN
jgi:hypothetical protein